MSHITWPFHTLGLDILDPFPIAKGQVKFLLVPIDYFTKWIKVEPIARRTVKQATKFAWKQIVRRHGLPHMIFQINFTRSSALSWGSNTNLLRCSILKLMGTANKVLLNELSKRMDSAKGLWAAELPCIIWAYHITPPSSNKETSFRLTYGVDAMILVEV